jgi:hypothetical protein
VTQDQCVFIRGFRVKPVLFGVRLIRIGSGSSPYRRATQRNNGLRNASSGERVGSSSSLDTIGPPENGWFYRNPLIKLRNASSGDDSLIGGSSSSLDTIGPPENPRPPSPPSPYRTQNNGLRNTSSGDDSLIGGSSSSLDTIGPPENPRRPPSPYPTQRNNGWFYRNPLRMLRNASSGDDSLIGGSSSSFLDTIRPPINHEYPYPSSTALQSNGDLCNASFTTSPSDDSY